jgi:hypothetical protein
MESKMKIKPIAGSQKSFKILNKRFQNGVSTKNKSGKSFSFKEDLQATKNLYQNIIDSLPSQPGILIITGHYKNSIITLEILKSNESIKSTFSRSQNSNRFQTLLDYLKVHLFNHIEIQLAQAS